VAAPLIFDPPVMTSSGSERRTMTAQQNNNKSQGEKACGCSEFHPEAVDGSSKPEDARRR
jgi:hypothetical protein